MQNVACHFKDFIKNINCKSCYLNVIFLFLAPNRWARGHRSGRVGGGEERLHEASTEGRFGGRWSKMQDTRFNGLNNSWRDG